jgi:hypothetical protein
MKSALPSRGQDQDQNLPLTLEGPGSGKGKDLPLLDSRAKERSESGFRESRIKPIRKLHLVTSDSNGCVEITTFGREMTSALRLPTDSLRNFN